MGNIISLRALSTRKRQRDDGQNAQKRKQASEEDGAKKPPALLDNQDGVDRQSAPRKKARKPDNIFIEKILPPLKGPFEHITEFLRVDEVMALSKTHKAIKNAIKYRLGDWKCQCDGRKLFPGNPSQCEWCDFKMCSLCTFLCGVCDEPGCIGCDDFLLFCGECDFQCHANADCCKYNNLELSVRFFMFF